MSELNCLIEDIDYLDSASFENNPIKMNLALIKGKFSISKTWSLFSKTSIHQ